MVEGELVSTFRAAKTADGVEDGYYLVRFGGVATPVTVRAAAVHDVERPKYRVQDVDFDNSRTVIAKNIRTFRHRANLSQSQLARQMGLSQNTISQWELGISVPRFYAVPALTRILGISTVDLYGDVHVSS